MNNQKPTDVILADFIKGQRRGRIFNFIITIAVPVVVLMVVFFGVGTISNQYTSAKQEIISELNDKTASIEGQKKEIDRLKSDLQITKNSYEMSTVEIKALSKIYDAVVKDNRSLRKRLGYGYVERWSINRDRSGNKNDGNKNDSTKTISQLR